MMLPGIADERREHRVARQVREAPGPACEKNPVARQQGKIEMAADRRGAGHCPAG